MKNYYLDVETYTWNNQKKVYEETLDTNAFYYGALRNPEGKTTFYTDKKAMYVAVCNALADPNAQIWAYHHAYDFYTYTKGNLQTFATNPNIKIIRTQPLLIINEKTGAKLLDLKTYFQGSLETLGNALNFRKLERKKEVHTVAELHDYLQRDIAILAKAVEKLLEIYAFTKYKPRKLLTASKSAMNRFTAYINKQPYAGYLFRKGTIHKNKHTIPFLRQASKGGRSETFKYGYHGNCTYYDANSFYWKIMRDMPFPDLLKETYYNTALCNIIPISTLLEKEGISRASVTIDTALHIGLLAIRYTPKKGEQYKLVFPKKKGTLLEGWWTHAELRFAQEHGYTVHTIHECVRYSKNLRINPLQEYIQTLYTYRLQKQKEGDMLGAKIIKQLGNGLYGKFVQQQEEKIYKWIPRWEKNTYEEAGWSIVGAQDTYVIAKKTGEYIPPHQSIIIGAQITAMARIALTTILLHIPKKQLLYCDTDGIIIKGKPPKAIHIGHQLGEFKIEAQGETYILKAKNYMCGDAIKIAGVPTRNHIKEFFTTLTPVHRPTMENYVPHLQNFSTAGNFNEEQVLPSYGAHEDLPLYIQEYMR